MNSVGEASGRVSLPDLTLKTKHKSKAIIKLCCLFRAFSGVLVMIQAQLVLTRRGLAEMRFPFFKSSDRRGDGGGVAFWAKSLFCGESSTRAPKPPSLGPVASAAGRNTPTP